MDSESINISKLLVEFKPLIYKTLNHFRIKKNNLHFDDYFQELQIKLVGIYKLFKGDPFSSDTDRYKFVAYATQGLQRHGANLLRDSRLNSFETKAFEEQDLDWFAYNKGLTTPVSKSSILLEDFFRQAKARLSAEDYILLLYLVDESYTHQEIADLMKLSRSTIYQRKNRIQERLQDIKECLMD